MRHKSILVIMDNTNNFITLLLKQEIKLFLRFHSIITEAAVQRQWHPEHREGCGFALGTWGCAPLQPSNRKNRPLLEQRECPKDGEKTKRSKCFLKAQRSFWSKNTENVMHWLYRVLNKQGNLTEHIYYKITHCFYEYVLVVWWRCQLREYLK